MQIIKKENVEIYRFCVAKIVFLRTNKNVRLVNDIPNSSLMVVEYLKGDFIGIRYVSMFQKPSDKSIVNDSIEFNVKAYPLIIYDRRKRSSTSKQDMDYYEVSNEAFNVMYDILLEEAFLRPDSFIGGLNTEERTIIDGVIEEKDNNNKYLYKYRSKLSVENNNYGINKGYISFSPVSTFNDPFDCNVTFSNNEDMSDHFRILCLTEEYDNILMWSYYGENHAGYCFEYKKQVIDEKIREEEIDGLCIFGDVDYKQKRPKVKSKVDKFSFTDINFYIDASFTKYNEWNHEKEVRYVLISSEYPEVDQKGKNNQGHINVKVTLNKVYEGIKGDNSTPEYLEAVEIIKVKKDDVVYKLNTEI